MAKIRAYKLAEEFGLEREEFLQKAAELGIELRTAMVSLEEEQVGVLREKFGAKPEVETEERRVGTGVIRRRRKKAAAPPAPAPPATAPSEPQAPEPALPSPEPI